MSGPAYYNEFDKNAAAWLRELIKQGHIAPGDVDERSIEDVTPNDLQPYSQCHFFAGIGGWSLALRYAGWPDDRPVWTGSCPCQPFSAAGKGAGFADERHLWPAFFHLIEQCRPPVVFGEQVASKDGLQWLDLVRSDLEDEDYAVGAADLCAAGFGAPHIRQRLYWVANSNGGYTGAERQQRSGEQRQQPENGGAGVWMADADEFAGRQGREIDGGWYSGSDARARAGSVRSVVLGGVENTGRRIEQKSVDPEPVLDGKQGTPGTADPVGGRSADRSGGSVGAAFNSANPLHGFWRAADWLGCRDGKWRPVEPGTFPLAHGLPARVGCLRGYGNAIVPQVAETFIRAVSEL